VLIQGSSDPPRLVRVGIDAAIVAQHEVCIRATDAQGRVRTDRFRVQPTENDKLIWPHCAGLIWPHPGVGQVLATPFLARVLVSR
jgi:hypothetical protein